MSAVRPVSVIKKIRFSAAHFFWLAELSDEDNVKRFGPTSNRNGHGHNYELEVTVTGPCDPETGMVINLKDLKVILQEDVVLPLDFKNLNLDVPYFKDRLPTLENLSVMIWERLQPRMALLSLTLSGIKLWEADDLYVEYHGG